MNYLDDESIEIHSNRRESEKRKRLGLSYLADFILVCIALLVFALFHHALPAKDATLGKPLPKPSPTISFESITSPTPVPTQSAAENNGESIPSESLAASETPIVYEGQFGEKFHDKFTDGEPIITENSYMGKNVSYTIDAVKYAGSTKYYFVDIYVRDVKYLRTAFAKGEFVQGRNDYIENVASDNNALIAINGDQVGGHSQGEVVRNGLLYRDKPWQDVCVLFLDGTMETYEASEFDMDEMAERGLWQVWGFGPMLLTDGKAMTKFNTKLNPPNPRTAIGYFEPGHYCFLMLEGRTDDTDGMKMSELSALMESFGCKAAYNLDGGATSSIAKDGELISYKANGGRGVTDIIYITDYVEEE